MGIAAAPEHRTGDPSDPLVEAGSRRGRPIEVIGLAPGILDLRRVRTVLH